MMLISTIPVATMALISTVSAWAPSPAVVPPISLSLGSLPSIIPTGGSSSLVPGTSSRHGSHTPSGSSTALPTGTSSKPSGTGIGPTGTGVGPTGTGSSQTSTFIAPTSSAKIVTESAGKSTITKTIYETKTYTDTITKFVPTSTPLATVSGTTYYSTSLTTSLTTTVYTTVIPQVTVIVPTAGSGLASSAVYCPPAPTVYLTVTVTEGGAQQVPTSLYTFSQPPSASNTNTPIQPQSSGKGAPSSPIYPLPSGSSIPIGSGTGTGTGSIVRPTASVSGTGKHPHHTATRN